MSIQKVFVYWLECKNMYYMKNNQKFTKIKKNMKNIEKITVFLDPDKKSIELDQDHLFESLNNLGKRTISCIQVVYSEDKNKKVFQSDRLSTTFPFNQIGLLESFENWRKYKIFSELKKHITECSCKFSAKDSFYYILTIAYGGRKAFYHIELCLQGFFVELTQNHHYLFSHADDEIFISDVKNKLGI